MKTFPILPALLAGCLLAACGPKEAPPAPEPPKVQVMEVQPQKLEIFDDIVATLYGSANTDVRAQVSGYLLKQNYTDGAMVKKGDLLFEIDPLPFKAALLKAEADVESALAQQMKAEQQESRNRELIKASAVSQVELETSIMANSAAKAMVKAMEAMLDRARLDLGYTKITAPISGVAGTSNPGVGDLVDPSKVLTTISAFDPIKAKFTISEQLYLKNAPAITAAMALKISERKKAFELIRADGTRHPQRGVFEYIDRQVESSTGALSVAALFPNADYVLRPGQYAKVRMMTDELPAALALPQRAILEVQGRYLVALVKDDSTVELRPVKVGARIGALWVVEEGLKTGDKVVVEGVLKCRPGQPVTPEPWTPVAPPTASNP